MSRKKPGQRFRLRFDSLENRKLLASSAQFAGVSGLDLAGPTAAAGPGGYENLEVKITIPLGSSSAATLRSLNIDGPSGSNFHWAFGNPTGSGQANPQALPGIVVAPEAVNPVTMTQSFDAYFSPVVAAINPTSGRSTLQQLPNGSPLAISATYTATDRTGNPTTSTDTSATDPALRVTAANLGSNLADPTPVPPSTVVGLYPGQILPQTADGNAHFTISNLPGGSSINASTAELSDVAGLFWNTDNPRGRAELSMTVAPASTSNGVTSEAISFPPERDESGSTLTFRYQLNGSNTWYVTDITVPASPTVSDPDTNPNLRDGTPIASNAASVVISPYPQANPAPDLVSYTDGSGNQHVTTIENLIASGADSIINLGDGTYPISQPLDLKSGLILQGVGSKATLDFTMTSVPQGAINFDASHITLNNFAIVFANPKVDFPDNNAAIISDEEQGSQHSRVDLNVNNLRIQAPQLANPIPDGQNQNAFHTLQTIFMDNFDSGTITNNTIFGGSISVQFGPWEISGNKVLGAVEGTTNFGAFQVTAGHDITLANNTVSDANPAQNGNIVRFFVANQGGYNVNLVDNSVSDNVGLIAPNPNAADPTGHPLNAPEEIAFEDYQKIYEGSVAAVGVSSSTRASDDRRVISIPTAELTYFDSSFPTTPPFNNTVSWALTLLDGPNAGTSIRVIQQDNQDPANPGVTSFLLDSPLPTGSYDLDIEPAFVNLTVSGNSINTAGTVSTGLVLGSTIINAQVVGNLFTGDQSSEDSGNHLLQSQAIRVNPYIAFGNNTQYLLPSIYNSYNVITATISDNTIVNAIGGVRMYIQSDASDPTTSTRTYGFVNFTRNQFVYSYSNPLVLSLGTTGDDSTAIKNTGVVSNAAAVNFTDPRTINLTASGNSIFWTNGTTPPATDVTVNAAEVNGTLDEANATPSLLTDLATLSTVQVPLGPVFNTVGITTNQNTKAASASGFDSNGGNPTGTTISANALGSLGGTLSWAGQTFRIGSPGVNNVVSLGGVGIELPPGHYATILMLGASTYGDRPAQFTVFYTDGTSTTFNQTMSDWAGRRAGGGAGTTYPGESIVSTMTYDNSSAGSVTGGTHDLYGYSFALDPTKTAYALGVSNDNDLKLVAVDLVKPASTPPSLVGPGSKAGLVGSGSGVPSGQSLAPSTQTNGATAVVRVSPSLDASPSGFGGSALVPDLVDELLMPETRIGPPWYLANPTNRRPGS